MAGDDEILDQVEALYARGAFLKALDAARPLGALRGWPGARGQVLGGRLASQLGAWRAGDALLLRAWRRWPQDPGALLQGAIVLNGTRGALAAIECIEARRQVLKADEVVQAECLALLARLYAFLRDFQVADELITPLAAKPASAWVLTQLALINEYRDDYGQALDAARAAFELNANSRSAIHYVSRYLSLQERDDEAIAVLRSALERTESAGVAAQLAELQIETGQFSTALATLDLYDSLTPLKDKHAARWLAGRRCDAYGALGDLERSREQARLADSPFYKQVAEQLAKAGPGERRVMLPVGFVRQHHMTCAPATLTALSRFWGREADHLGLAEEICYDGTPHPNELRWARENGWYPRDFTVTWDSARALIDAGIPFTLTTVYPDSAHLQAVVGYDGARGTLLIRDPYERTYGEFTQAAFFESHAANGPRGMVLIPAGQEQRLASIDLPEADLHERFSAVQDALVRHERERALSACAALEADAPRHRLTIHARRSVAIYDSDAPRILAANEALLEHHPRDISYRLWKAASLRTLAPRPEYLAWLQSMAEEPRGHSLAKLRYAQALLEDDRRRQRATKLLRRVLAQSPRSAEALSAMGDVRWQMGDAEAAVPCYRLAAAVEETDEGYAMAYFRAARMVRGQARAIEFLRERCRRLDSRSPQPAVTLYKCLDELERTEEALVELDGALARHPRDGALLLFAARVLPAAGQSARARDLLESARGSSKPSEWLQAAGWLSESDGRLDDACAFLLQAVRLEPLNLQLQRDCVRLKDLSQGREAAVAHLREAVDLFPHHLGLNELLIEWLGDEPAEQREAALRSLLQVDPTNAWAERELALVLGAQQRYGEARDAVERARALAQNSINLHNVSGHLYSVQGERPQARADFRRALQISADDGYSIRQLVEACASLEERRIELDFIAQELKRQVLRGDGLLTFQSIANATLAPQAVLALLEEAHAARPDLWQSWIARTRQLAEMGQMDAARAVAAEAQKRFPLLPRVHLERAEILRLAGDGAEERQALAEALRTTPGWTRAAQKLADSLEAGGDYAGSRQVLERALRHNPTDAPLHGYLADCLWQLGEQASCLEHLERAVQLDPGYDWAWHTLKARAAEVGSPLRAYECAKRLSAKSPGDTRCWRALASTAADAQESLQALARAVATAPASLAAHTARADFLIKLGRYDEAIAAVQSTVWGTMPPVALALRAARARHAKGEKDAALAALEALLAADRNSYEAWDQLADWRRDAEQHAAYLEAARELHRVAPNDHFALGTLAHASLAVDAKAEVRELLRQALRLKPDYQYAAFELFDEELKAGALQEAGRVLEEFARHSQDAGVPIRRIRLCAARNDREGARKHFSTMLERHADADSVKLVLAAFADKRWVRDCQRIIERAARLPSAPAEVGTLWAQRRAERGRWSGLHRVLANPACGHSAARAYLDHCATKRAAFRLRWLIWRRGHFLAQDDDTHGMVGYALVECGKAGAAVRWFRRFPPRDSTPPWALLNLAAALRDVRRDEEAARWSRAALERPQDVTTARHRVWLALDAARRGEAQSARAELQQVVEDQLTVYYQFLCCLIRALLVAADAPREQAFDTGMREVRRAKALMPRFMQDRCLQRLTWHTVTALSRRRGGMALLGWLRSLDLWLAF